MSTAKNRSKEEPEKTMSTRRSAKSTERESIAPSSDKKPFPLIYQCSKCNAILAQENLLFRTIELDETVFLFPVQMDKFVVNTDQVLLSSESEYDQFCAFYLVLCANPKCNSPLGKFYLSTTEKISEAKNALVIPEKNMVIYDVNVAKVVTPAAKKKPADATTAKKKVMSSTAREEKENKEKEQKSAHKEVSFAQQDKGFKYQSPMNTRIQEERKLDERSPNPLLESEEKDISQIKQVDNSFSEMKSILTNFAQLLEQFDIRLSSSEKTILLINKTLNEIYKTLDVQEVIDLSE